MQQFFKLIAIFVCFGNLNNLAIAGPWLTGPLLAPSGHTIPRGHTNLEVYGLNILSNGQYNASGQIIPNPLFQTVMANPVFSHGLTDWLDVQMIVPYAFNSTRGVHYNRITDVAASIGLQLLEQKGHFWKPDLRFAVQQVFPTGKFERLNPQLAGTDSTGLGSYQTTIAFNFQHVTELFKTHYLRTRLSLSHLYSSAVTINGLSSYGGTVNTQGRIRPGGENDADLAFEFTVTKNWVAVMEGYISQGEATRFNGILTTGNIGGPPVNVGSGDYYEEALAPAIEYNFNENIGLIGGIWFPIKGKNTANYTTYVLALNAFW